MCWLVAHAIRRARFLLACVNWGPMFAKFHSLKSVNLALTKRWIRHSRTKPDDWLILTSVNGVDALWERLRKLHIGGKPMLHLKVAAIGPATAQAIERHGVKVNVIPKGKQVAESVVASLRRKVKGKRVLLARAKVARDVIPQELHKLGAHVDVVVAYPDGGPRNFT